MKETAPAPTSARDRQNELAPPLGRHVLADLRGVAPLLLRDVDRLRDLLIAAAHAARARVLDAHFHRFGGAGGVTGVVLLSESHITLHTWPEHGYAALDIFMCGQADPNRALAHLRAALAPTRADVTSIPRGAQSESRAEAAPAA